MESPRGFIKMKIELNKLPSLKDLDVSAFWEEPCPKCGEKLKVMSLSGDVFCKSCGFKFEILNMSVMKVLLDYRNKVAFKYVRKARKEEKRQGSAFSEILEENGGRVKIKWKYYACPFCGASDEDAYFDYEKKSFVWMDDDGQIHVGMSPIDWGYIEIRPGYALCLNCKREFKVENEATVSIRGIISNEAEIRRECPRCKYSWFKFGKYKSFKRFNRFIGCGIIGYRCLACGESFYFKLQTFEAPLWEPVVLNVKSFSSIRKSFSWEEHHSRFKSSVFGPYLWKKEVDGDGVVTPDKKAVRKTFEGYIMRTPYGISRARRERTQVDFEARVKLIILNVLENECLSRQKQRIIEEVLRFTRYLWINFNKRGRSPEYLILAIIHFVYSMLAREKEPERRETFPLKNFWQRLAPNRKFNLKSYEKNVDFVLDCLEISRLKRPNAFKMFMWQLLPT
ncbi:MAG: hypothetical protein QXJ07_01900 [Candidatus Bathyarchaeia archaeon]